MNFITQLFRPVTGRFRKAPEPPVEVKVWPHPLNPCTNKDHHRKNLYNVGGRVTQCCSDCVFSAEKEGITREEYLATKTPDLEGALCR